MSGISNRWLEQVPTKTLKGNDLESSGVVKDLTVSEIRTMLGITATVYGIRWDQSTDTMVKGVVLNGIFIESTYAQYPVQETMARVLRDAASGSESALDPDDSNYLIDGTTATTVDGSAGDIQVKIPSHYQLWLRDGNYQYILLSWDPFSFEGEQAWIPLCFRGKQYYYQDAFEGILYDNSAASLINGQDATAGLADKTADALRSLPGFIPWVYEDRSDFRTLCTNRGGTTHQNMWDAHQMIASLFVTEYGTWSSQSELPGYTEANSTNFAYARSTGRTMGLGDYSGSIVVDLTGVDSDLDGVVSAGDYVANSFHGIENIFGHFWKNTDGLNIDNTSGNGRVYTCTDPSNFADDTATNYVDTGHAPAFGSDDGYIADILGSGKHCPLYASDISGGSSSTYLCDYSWNDTGGWRTGIVSGFRRWGTVAGIAYLATDGGSSIRDAKTCSRGAAVSDS